MDLLAIGEVMAEIRHEPTAGFRVGFAGDTFNTAVYCAREFGPLARIGYCTRVGCDPLSHAFLSAAKDEGIDVSQVGLDQERNLGIYTVSTDNTGEYSFHYWRSNSAARLLFASGESLASLPPAKVVYLSAITLAILHPSARRGLIAHLRDLRGRSACHVAFDSNYRPQLWENAEIARQSVREMWEVADIALPSVDDEIALFGDPGEEAVFARFAASDWRACAIKRGALGPVSPRLARSAHPEFSPAPDVVDTTAAGDSFNGGYLAAFLHGEDEGRCLLAGHKIASRVVGARGALIARS
ncbi:MAG: sugar kinase [Alphaproteobacteria bacterium]|nr:sugar kinase [Alphaproteobacteria bacterium]